MKKLLIPFIAVVLALMSCTRQTMDNTTAPTVTTISEDIKRPNIIWFVAEDLSPVLPDFGDPTIATPTLSRLAKEGICYDQFFSPAPVCAPARSAIATGMYPTHIGSNHMRTGSYIQYLPEGMQPYEPILPNGVKMMSETLRSHGYYCTNNSKEDYQYKKSIVAWDESSKNAHWKNKKEGQPFFSIFNFNVTHESRIWAKAKDSLWVDSDLKVEMPPYLPDTEVGRNDYRRMYSNIKEMDHQVGLMIKELEDAGELDNTIIMWYTDHGGPLPRQKRLLYDSGIKVPMIIRFPDQTGAGTRNDDLTSFIDLAPTVLSLAGIPPSDKIDGKAFLGPYKRKVKAKYIYAAGDRFDKQYDKIRAVRDKRYKYIKYYETKKPMFLPVAYRDQMPIMQELHRLRAEGGLNAIQSQWFRNEKPEEELFDTQTDPHEINDISKDPQYADKLNELRNALADFQQSIPDLNFKPELEYFEELWPDGKQPITASPVVIDTPNGVTISSSTENASLGYQIIPNATSEVGDKWQVYTDPVTIDEGEILVAKAHRVGYIPSEEVRISRK